MSRAREVKESVWGGFTCGLCVVALLITIAVIMAVFNFGVAWFFPPIVP